MYALNDFAALDSDLALSLDDLDLVLGGDGPEPGTHEDQPTNTSNGAPPATPNINPVSVTVDANISSTETHTDGGGPMERLAETVQDLGHTVSDVVHQGADIVYDFAHPILSAIGTEGGQIITAVGDAVEGYIRGDAGSAH